MEKNLVKVLKGLAEFNDESHGEVLEKIVLHSFEPVVGDEDESYGVQADPHAAWAWLRGLQRQSRDPLVTWAAMRALAQV